MGINNEGSAMNREVSCNGTACQMRVKGPLDSKWSDWFDGFTIIPQACDQTVLSGTIADQAALHGMLAIIRDLGLPLISVHCSQAGE
jgi:hypothetical protein